MIHASDSMPRVSVKLDRPKGRKACPVGGCQGRRTHHGRANGCTLFEGCAFHVAMWVRSPMDVLRAAARQAPR